MVDRDAPYSGLASIMAMNGRYGDTELVHMSKPEIRGLASLGELTINPETGLPEAFSLGSMLPIVANIALGVATGGMSIPAQMAIMGGANFVMGKAAGQSTGDALLGGAMAAGGAGLSGAIGGSAVKGGGKGAATAGAGTDAIGSLGQAGTEGLIAGGESIASGVVNTAPLTIGTGSLASPYQAVAGAIPNAGGSVGGSQGGVSAFGDAVNKASAPSSGIMDWISENPLKTAAGGLGIAGLLAGGDEEYPEEEPVEIKSLPQFERVGGDRIDRNYTEKELVRLYTDGTLADPEREKLLKYHTDSKFNLIGPDHPNYAPTSEVKFANTGGLLSLNNNDASQSSGVSNFLQQGNNNNADSEQGIFNAMFNMGASVAGKANDKEESNVVGPVVVSSGVQQSPAAQRRADGGIVSLAEGERPRPKSNTAFNLEDFNSLVKLGVGYPELERMLNGETAASKSIAKRLIATNPDSGAVGIFQFIPKVAKELGTSTAKIKKMTVKEQSDLYAKYLKRWKYKPGIPLGMMQAAPAYANKPNDFVAYKKGSRAFEQNPGWIGDDGKITAGSIKRYYNKDNDIEQSKEEQTITGRPSPQQPIVQQQQARPRPKDKPIPPERPSIQQPIVQQQQEEGGGFLEGLQTLLMGNDTQETVNKGDTLTALAKKYGMSLEELLEANEKIKNSDKINVGQQVNIPDNSNILDRISKLIKFSEGGTLEQYYQGQVIGRGDGMSDEILFDVEGENPDMALLSRDEYVIPADVVSMIGNGSSNAGAEQLDGFLKNVRNESFGTTKQQKQMTNPQRGLSALM